MRAFARGRPGKAHLPIRKKTRRVRAFTRFTGFGDFLCWPQKIPISCRAGDFQCIQMRLIDIGTSPAKPAPQKILWLFKGDEFEIWIVEKSLMF